MSLCSYAYTAISSSKNIIKYLPSAGRGNWLTGHFPECFSYDPDIFSEECYRTLGPIHVIGGLFGVRTLLLQLAINIFTHISAASLRHHGLSFKIRRLCPTLSEMPMTILRRTSFAVRLVEALVMDCFGQKVALYFRIRQLYRTR